MTLLPAKGPTKEGTDAYRQAMGEEEDEEHTIARRTFYDGMAGQKGYTFGGFFANMVRDDRERADGGCGSSSERVDAFLCDRKEEGHDKLILISPAHPSLLS